MKNNEILSYSSGTKYAYMPKDVKHTLNQMYNERLKKKRKAFNKRKRRHKDFTNHIHNKKSSYGKRNITDTKEENNKLN